MTYVFVDYETRSPIELSTAGQDQYLEKAEVLMVGLGFEDGSTLVRPGLSIEKGLTFVSWGGFDREVARRVEGLDCPDWIDARLLAQMCGLPASLEAFCTAIGVPAKKDPRGTRLINKYSKPLSFGGTPLIADTTQKPMFLKLEGDDLKAFEEYCLKDVVLLQQAWRFLAPLVKDYERHHKTAWETYDRMNKRGVPIDVPAAKRALYLCMDEAGEIEEECLRRFGFKTTQVAEVVKVLGTKDCTRDTLKAYKPKTDDQAWLRDARLTTSKAATKKLVPMIDMASEDGRIHGAFHYHGAHTGRGTSMGVQFQNLKKAVVDPIFFDMLHGNAYIEHPTAQTQVNIRGFIKAPEDHTFVIVDYAQVEARILSWIAEESFLKEAFVQGRDVYREFAARVYGVPLLEVTDAQRSHGKATVLGCGYGMGPKKLVVQAAAQGTIIPPSMSQELVDSYRSAYPAIPALWKEIDYGIKSLIRGFRDVFTAGKCVFTISRHRTMLRIELPSNRVLRYFMPRLSEKNEIVYDSRFGPVTCWGGHFVENICQAIGGDLKIDAMQRADRLGFRTVMEVHDELVIEEHHSEAANTMNIMLMVMADPPDWFDEPGLIVGEGKLSERFTK